MQRQRVDLGGATLANRRPGFDRVEIGNELKKLRNERRSNILNRRIATHALDLTRCFHNAQQNSAIMDRVRRRGAKGQ